MSFAYQRTISGGLALKMNGGTILELSSESEFAMLREGGILHKHGDARMVRSAEAHMSAVLRAIGGPVEEFEILAIPVADICDDVLNDINRSLSTTGYIAGLAPDFGTSRPEHVI